MENDNKIKLNIHMFIFLNIITITIFNDIIIYLTNLTYNYSLIISSILVFILYKFVYKKSITIEKNFDKNDIIPILFICALSIFKLLTIDDFIDTLTYHLYNQLNPFIDKINFDLLPSSTFFFPLGDRMNYIFVNFLGIRFGTILSCYVIVILYYQFKNILHILIPNLSTKMRLFYMFLIATSNSVTIYIGSFFIDSFSSILLFELVYIFIQNINLLKNKKYLYLCSFLLGCLIGIKITNLFLGITIILLLLIRNIKENGLNDFKYIKFYDFLLLIFIAILPFIIYMINNYIQTGNPIFPLGNNIFNSKYYKNISATDSRLGPKNLLEFFFWPILICFDMKKGNDIHSIVENVWGLGYIFTIYSLFTYKKRNSKFNWFSILVIILTFVWIKFILGYVRYGLVLSYCFHIIILYYFDKEILNIKNSFNEISTNFFTVFKSFAKLILIYILIITFILVNLAYFSYYFNVIKKYNIQSNISPLSIITAPYDIDGVWLCSRYNNYYTDILREKSDPMYNLDIITPLDPMCNLPSGYSDYSQKLFKEKTKNKSLYMAIPFNNSINMVKLLEINNLKVIETIGIYKNNKYFNPYNFALIIKVKFNN